MHNPESVLDNETHKFLWDIEIQTDHLISARRPDFIIINKKQRTCRIVDFDVAEDHRVKLKEYEKRDNISLRIKEDLSIAKLHPQINSRLE